MLIINFELKKVKLCGRGAALISFNNTQKFSNGRGQFKYIIQMTVA